MENRCLPLLRAAGRQHLSSLLCGPRKKPMSDGHTYDTSTAAAQSGLALFTVYALGAVRTWRSMLFAKAIL